jgi:S-adenosylmethionine:tRNA ribosyltransferase-isomerase
VIAADRAVQRPPDARLLVIDGTGTFHHATRRSWITFLHPGDLVVANDAATLPASLHGIHDRTGSEIEVRLAGWLAHAPDEVSHFAAVVFGNGDYHTRTEHRPPPPPLLRGDRLSFGPLTATIVETLGHPRLVSLRFEGSRDEIWAGFARHGHPIQYAHLSAPLALWDVWTVIAGPPVAFEPPSAGFVIDWATIGALRARSVGFATVTHAAGISSTGDEDLDRRLPLDEPYVIPITTANAIAATHARNGRIVAIGTTVVRALEHAADGRGGVRAGAGVASERIDAATRLTVVDVIVSGTHEPGTTHHDLLGAFVSSGTLARADEELNAAGYLTHEFGDSVMIERKNEI